ncbi:NAD-dependent malic enzyme [Serinibacter arcticus]|uniref:NAD-dependent malic enzyme n=1 Tax=Serinibacter arcticus TaxID=1655435 RepID=A0A2U1ZXN7_9MICO|nr:NAD-dependent malic enzyme [Serinibacter arcticus]PWD51746.1 NAD-dependent malic enzyme [Serinibacter arcticus]
MSTPSVSNSITIRLEVPSHAATVSTLTSVVEREGGVVTAVDVSASGAEQMQIDLTVATGGEADAKRIVDALRELPEVTVGPVSDRVFLAHLGGKLTIESRVPIRHRDDLSLVYTPGVARVSKQVAEHPEDARRLTIKRNTIAVVSDGSAVLGLGNIGPLGALPVMEGKAALFKRFAGIDAFPLVLDTQDVEEIIATVKNVAPVFAGINLEDISAPRCFEIEARLRAELDIPVFHDDQHGTGIVATAALLNALKVVGKKIEDVRVVLSGAGAAGSAVLRMMQAAGVRDVTVVDIDGIIHTSREGMHPSLQEIADKTNPRNMTGKLSDAIVGADVFVGVSAPNILSEADVQAMAPDAIVFALANPVSEIDPAIAARHAAVVASGRSDYANQINNVLAFPGVFRGLLDARSNKVTDEMLLAAARALAAVVTPGELNPTYVIPSVFHPEVHETVAEAVRKAAEAAR